jgi:hypothetical protein
MESVGLRYRNQSAKAETLIGSVGNRVRIGRGPEASRREGACHSLARREKDMQEREVRGNGPFKGPSASGEWVTGHKVDVVRRTGKEIYREKLDGIT